MRMRGAVDDKWRERRRESVLSVGRMNELLGSAHCADNDT